MDIDLSLLQSNTVDDISITGVYNIPDDYIDKNLVKSIKDIKVDGKVYIDNDLEKINCSIEGNIEIEDSVSLEVLNYPISIEYDDKIEENWKKSEKILDIFSFLWENIVLEIPMHYSKVEDFSGYKGDGWKLVSEDELIKNNNPFSDLLKDFKEE